MKTVIPRSLLYLITNHAAARTKVKMIFFNFPKEKFLRLGRYFRISPNLRTFTSENLHMMSMSGFAKRMIRRRLSAALPNQLPDSLPINSISHHQK